MTRRSRFLLTSILLSLFVITVVWPRQLAAQLASPSTTSPAETAPELKPLSLPDLYWQFLLYLNFLDTRAAALQAQGKDGAWLRNDLQTRLHFSDADFAPIRSSSQRLDSELNALSQQATALAKEDPAWSASQLEALNAQRKADVDNEIYNLSQELSPQNKATLEAFLVSFFAPKTIAYTPPASAGSKAVKP